MSSSTNAFSPHWTCAGNLQKNTAATVLYIDGLMQRTRPVGGWVKVRMWRKITGYKQARLLGSEAVGANKYSPPD